MFTEEDTKTIAHIRFYSKWKKIAKLSTYAAGDLLIKVYDYGLESGSNRFYVEVEYDREILQSTEAYHFPRVKDALKYIDWPKIVEPNPLVH